MKLYIRDNVHGTVREYGTNQHDMLCAREKGSYLYYENLQNSCGSLFPDEGYSFCNPDGSDFEDDGHIGRVVNIGGDAIECAGDFIRAMDNERLARFLMIWQINFISSFFESGFTETMDGNQIREWLNGKEWSCKAVYVGDDFIFDSDFNLKEECENDPIGCR